MTHAITNLLSLKHADKRRRAAFAAVPRFKWVAADRAHISMNDRNASVRFDAAGDLRFTVPVDARFDPNTALDFNRDLPGNLRLALDRRRLQLVADMRDDIPDMLHVTAADAQAVLDGSKPHQEPSVDGWDKGTVNELLHKLSRDEDSLLELQDGWEYRPRVAGQAVAVKLNLHGGHLRCHRAVIQVRADQGVIQRAAAIEALRFNARVKHARLARVGERLIAETWLRRCFLDADSFSVALRAVAVVERRVHAALAILVHDEQVAAHYSSLFDCFEPTPSSC